MQQSTYPNLKTQSPKRSVASYPLPHFKPEEKYQVENEETCEGTFQQHGYHKTWDQEMSKVTEYNESMEYSASNDDNDLAGKMGELKITSSITDRFPKFSIASLCFSDSSGNQLLDGKRIDCEIVDNLDVVIYAEKNELEEAWEIEECFDRKDLEVKETMQGTKESFDTEFYGRGVEDVKEMCGCGQCLII